MRGTTADSLGLNGEVIDTVITAWEGECGDELEKHANKRRPLMP